MSKAMGCGEWCGNCTHFKIIACRNVLVLHSSTKAIGCEEQCGIFTQFTRIACHQRARTPHPD